MQLLYIKNVYAKMTETDNIFCQTYDKHIFTFAVIPILMQNITAWNTVLAAVA